MLSPRRGIQGTGQRGTLLEGVSGFRSWSVGFAALCGSVWDLGFEGVAVQALGSGL